MAIRARRVLRVLKVPLVGLAHPAIRAPRGLLALLDPRVSDQLVQRDPQVLMASPVRPGLLAFPALRVPPVRRVPRALLVLSARPVLLAPGLPGRLALRVLSVQLARLDLMARPARTAQLVRPV